MALLNSGNIRDVKINIRQKRGLVAGVALLAISSCARAPEQINLQTYAQEIEQWQAKRLASLTGESGWLTLIGLFWLKEGKNTFGSDATGGQSGSSS